MLKHINFFAFLFFLLLLTLWMRVQGIGNIPEGQFTETDGYFYYWQASQISEKGKLPARDMQRWLPVGRDLGQTLNLYGYVLSYTHKAISVVFRNVTLYHVCVYMPVVCFCLGRGVLCLYLYQTYGATHIMLTGKNPSRSFLHGDLSDAFLPVYPKQNVATATVKVWEIAYPPDIESDPKYLKTGFRDINAFLETETAAHLQVFRKTDQ